MHGAALLAQENANLRAENEKKSQKRRLLDRKIEYEGGLLVEKGLELV